MIEVMNELMRKGEREEFTNDLIIKRNCLSKGNNEELRKFGQAGK